MGVKRIFNFLRKWAAKVIRLFKTAADIEDVLKTSDTIIIDASVIVMIMCWIHNLGEKILVVKDGDMPALAEEMVDYMVDYIDAILGKGSKATWVFDGPDREMQKRGRPSKSERAKAFSKAVHLLFFSGAHGAKSKGREMVNHCVRVPDGLLKAIKEGLERRGQLAVIARGRRTLQ